jgi:hypothetical protein
MKMQQLFAASDQLTHGVNVTQQGGDARLQSVADVVELPERLNTFDAALPLGVETSISTVHALPVHETSLMSTLTPTHGPLPPLGQSTIPQPSCAVARGNQTASTTAHEHHNQAERFMAFSPLEPELRSTARSARRRGQETLVP